jgi:hypothetical protein
MVAIYIMSYPVNGGDVNLIHLVYTTYTDWHHVIKLESIPGKVATAEEV